MADATHKFQSPRGTRDFYPADMAVRRHIESIWREVSINHGFDEIDGPTFEHLELYTAKSGPGIVSELFSFQREGGETMYALRPEFTPTLARMYAARAGELPKPVKWFCIESNFRAERPQRGRLREFFQWNADIIGDESPRADAEMIALTVGILERFGLTAEQVVVKLNDRHAANAMLDRFGVPAERHEEAFGLIDRRDKITAESFTEQAEALGLSGDALTGFLQFVGVTASVGAEVKYLRLVESVDKGVHDRMNELESWIGALQLQDWCRWDPAIVRGLAYYTGTVFEVHEISGKERAIAGGGRYDKLVELVGGPPTPAVGIAMGDVVLRLMLEDHGLLKPEEYAPRPDVFVINVREDDKAMSGLIADLRRRGMHVRHSYRATRNVGKLLGEAGKARARWAVILGEEFARGALTLKDLDSGEQREVKLDELAATLEKGV